MWGIGWPSSGQGYNCGYTDLNRRYMMNTDCESEFSWVCRRASLSEKQRRYEELWDEWGPTGDFGAQYSEDNTFVLPLETQNLFVLISHMQRDAKPNFDLVASYNPDFDQKSYNITDTKKWFRIGGWDKDGEGVAEIVAKSVYGGWCVDGVFAGQYGKSEGLANKWGTSLRQNFGDLF